jgi:peptidoglycan/xylan/chitin deacetylase (PgdA/CDA1 family)
MDVRKAVKGLAAFAVDRSGARATLARVRRVAAGGRRVLVFGYHRVCNDFELERQRSIESCLISKPVFAQHVAFLEANFELATMTRAVNVLSGRETATRDLAVITFDDGYRDVLENALPVLQEAGAPATIYLSSGVVDQAGHFPHDRLYTLLQMWTGSPGMRTRASSFAQAMLCEAQAAGGGSPRQWIYQLIRSRSPGDLERLCRDIEGVADFSATPPEAARALTWEDARALAAGGFEIGAHTTTHCVLTHLDAARVETDLRVSREAVERGTGQSVRHFAYCNGYYNQTVIAALKRTGYLSAVTTEDRMNRLGDDPYRIARRILWERSAAGPLGATSPSLLACQLDDAGNSLGFDASESGERPEPPAALPAATPERRLA